ncbi:phosphoenolpyruvate--protein phosphotransferase [Granulosicoccaceae sp. 1_MG-2023]|nr:phosphoenolpyruvate--protein phosphotransferase [Granulosicoccaceae sp. 1_MG-2023]
MFCGIGVSRGVAIAPAYVLNRHRADVKPVTLDKKGVTKEIRRFRSAINTARKQLEQIRGTIPEDAPEDISSFIETHLLMLDDATLSERPVEIMRAEACNAEWALKLQREAVIKVFDSMDDPYIATRKDDVNHVIDQVMRILVEKQGDGDPFIHDWSGQIVVADDLSPADTVLMQHQGVAGFITETGGQLSHTAILARSLGIPAIVGVSGIRRYIRNSEELVIDGEGGLVLGEADDNSLSYFRRQQREIRRKQRELSRLLDTQSVTLCGEEVTLLANIEIEEDIKLLKKSGADGVGLYRTEFLYMNRDSLPGESDHFSAYKRVLRALKGAPLTIRTVDLGGDKESAAAPSANTHNPALGLRGVRRSLNEPRIFNTQLRAILRASAYGPVRLMFPMLSNTAEIDQALGIVEQTKEELRAEGIKFDENLPVGGMIEVPAAAIIAQAFAEKLDFLSIGTNDLIQYTLAIDRVDDQVNYLYDPLHPAVLQLIRMTIDAGQKAGIPVSMCGEMAGDTRYTRLLLSLGLRQLSMPPKLLLEVKNVITQTDIKAIRRKALNIVNSTDSERQARLIETLNRLAGTEKEKEKEKSA